MLKGFFVEKNLLSYLDQCDVNYGKFMRERMMHGVGIFLLCLVGGFFMGSNILYAASPIAFIGGYKLNYFLLYRYKNTVDGAKAAAFPQFLRTFMALHASQGTIYKTLDVTSQHIDEPLYTPLRELVSKIDVDNDYKHYIAFADYVGTVESHMVMSMIHSFSETGAQPDELAELERMIERINVNKMDEVIRQKASAQEKYTNPTILLSVGFVMFLAITVIVQNFAKFTSLMTF